MKTRSDMRIHDGVRNNGVCTDGVRSNTTSGDEQKEAALDQQWWKEVQRGMKKHIEKKQASETCETVWGLFGIGLLLCWLAFSDTGSSFWKQVFGGIIMTECLLGDGCLLGRKTTMPEWVHEENNSARKRTRAQRRAWRNMYSESSDEN
jgi:hypothetical protein